MQCLVAFVLFFPTLFFVLALCAKKKEEEQPEKKKEKKKDSPKSQNNSPKRANKATAKTPPSVCVTVDSSVDSDEENAEGVEVRVIDIPPDSVEVFKKAVKDIKKLGVPGLAAEYEAVKKETPAAKSHLAFDKNEEKNRYKDIACEDETRVILKWPPSHTDDYIHANWSTTADGRKYILTQGPIDKTSEDFWRMAWQEKAKAILMLCCVEEGGKRKCVQYWPRKIGESMTFDELTIVCIDKRKKKEKGVKGITISTLQISDGKETHTLEHVHWKSWPDKGVPRSFLDAFAIIQRSRLAGSPIIAHCSAGIGRTGTLVGLDIFCSRLAAGEPATLKESIIELRRCREGSVQTESQYVFIARALVELAIHHKIVKPNEARKFLKQYTAYTKKT